MGIIPELEHCIPDEDLHSLSHDNSGSGVKVAVVSYPQMSNFDEFRTLHDFPGVQLTWARDPSTVRMADMAILPGSRHVAADLDWMRRQGIDAAIRDVATAGRPLLGICGGLQMLGEAIQDPNGLEGSATGLGLLPLRTEMQLDKKQTQATTRFADRLPGPWAAMSGIEVQGYEIRHGITKPTGTIDVALPGGRGYVTEGILAVYLHGLFENPAVAHALFGVARDYRAELDRSVDQVSAALGEYLDMAAIEAIL
jgi:adenosylcobyric acid synthase